MDFIREAATRYFTGSAGQQRVPEEFLLNLEIPLPNENLQEKCISFIGKNDKQIDIKENEILQVKKNLSSSIEAFLLGKELDKITS